MIELNEVNDFTYEYLAPHVSPVDDVQLVISVTVDACGEESPESVAYFCDGKGIKISGTAAKAYPTAVAEAIVTAEEMAESDSADDMAAYWKREREASIVDAAS